MRRRQRPAAFDPRSHAVAGFASGQARLDAWLRHSAGQGQRRDASRTFVVLDDRERVIGYYTLLAAEVDFAQAGDELQRGLSKRFPVPVCLLARLAVDQRHQGQGLGAALLADALTRAAAAAEHVGMRAIVVDAIDEAAAGFYRRFGLLPLSDDGLTLMVTIAHVRASSERREELDEDAPR